MEMIKTLMMVDVYEDANCIGMCLQGVARRGEGKKKVFRGPGDSYLLCLASCADTHTNARRAEL